MTIPEPNSQAAIEFVAAIANPRRREDCERLLEIIKDITGESPALWGKIIGFGTYHYKYATGREGDSMKIGFAPGKQHLSLYGVISHENNRDCLGELGPHKTGKCCLYIKRLNDIHLDVLQRMIEVAYKSYELAG